MRGFERNQEGLFSCASPQARVPADHPLRAVRVDADEALRHMSRVFNAMYADGGRPSVPPETLLKSTLLMARYTVHVERLSFEMLEHNLDQLSLPRRRKRGATCPSRPSTSPPD